MTGHVIQIPENFPENIPRYTLGVDLETKSVNVNSYILSIGGVLIDNLTLKIIDVLSLNLLADDPQQSNRDVLKYTMDWWDVYDGTTATPSPQARDIAFGGNMDFKTAMQLSADYFGRITKQHGPNNLAVPMRGPDFDYVILRDAWRQVGIWRTPLHARMLDSHRTVERVVSALKIPPATDEEYRTLLGGNEVIHHVAPIDAAIEAYDTARMYHILHAVSELGYKEALSRIDGFRLNAVEELERIAENAQK